MTTRKCGLTSRSCLGAILCCLGFIVGCRTSRFSDKAIAFVHPGETTRSEVIENLGPPHFEAKENRAIGYLWETVAGTESRPVLRAEENLPILSTETSEWGRVKHALCFQFDYAGRVKRFEKIVIQPGQAADAALVEWSRSGAAP